MLAPSAVAADDAKVQELKDLAQDMEPFSLRAIGLPVGASEWAFLGEPFWSEWVPSDGKITVQLNSMSEMNLDGGEVFRLTSQGTFHVADIVANYGAGEVAQLDGLDLAGAASTFEQQAAVIDAYMPVISEALQERFGLETLGGAHSTPQVFFCRGEVSALIARGGAPNSQ